MNEGRAVFDSNLRAAGFIEFMRGRQRPPADPSAPLAESTLAKLERAAQRLANSHPMEALVAVPSRSWGQREALARWLAERLGLRLELDVLGWSSEPRARQGELLNNDQRRANIKGCMSCNSPLDPDTNILLLDDYTGSLATLREAVTTLRKQGGVKGGEVTPLCVASVRWRLGRSGMV